MNYYNRYPAHYLAKTLLLTLEQDGAYTRLMDWYYAEERAIPDDKRYTVARCQSKREREAADFVLREFFELIDGCWVHDRIEKELYKAAPKIDAARENGKKGGRPRKEKPTGFPENNPLGFQNETQQKPSAKAPQTPYPNNYVGSTEASPQVATRAPTEAGRACLLMRQRGCIHTNPSHPHLVAAIAEGVMPEALADTAAEAIAAGKSKPFAWAIATARSRHAEGAQQINGATHANGTSGRKLSAAEQVQQAILERRSREGSDEPGPFIAIGN